MVIDNLNVVGGTSFPPKADPPLIAYADAVLARAISLQLLQAIARRNTQVLNPFGGLELNQLSQSQPGDCRESSRWLAAEEPFRLGATETADHCEK